MNFRYDGYDKNGAPARGVIEAGDQRDASEKLRKQGIFATTLAAAGEGAQGVGPDAGGARSRAMSGATVERVADMMRQLSLLISTGTPMVEAIASMERQLPPGPWRNVVSGVRERVEEGRSLAAAMGAYPDSFDAVCCSLVAAGESGGKLSEMLDRLAKLLRQQVRLRKAVSHALVYPALLVCVAVGVICVMLFFVLPRFESLFSSLRTPLPTMTRVLMDVSAALRANWVLAASLAVGSIAGVWIGLRTQGGQRAIDGALVRLPVVGVITRCFATARIARVMGTLLEGRVPMVEALGLARGVVRNTLYTALLTRAESAVLRGESMGAALGEGGLLTPAALEAIRSGERSGQLAPVLSQVADFLDEDTEVSLRTLMGLLEPAILLALGLVVGTMAVAMLLPLFDLTAAGGGGTS